MTDSSNSSLATKKFLLIDCQTTGMRPSVGSLLEFSWGWASSVCESCEISSSLIQLPEGASIPPRVREITGIRSVDMEAAHPLDDVRAEFISSLALSGEERPVALIHYAQFEEAWLRDLLGVAILPFDVICTLRLSKKLFPLIPSRNIRGLTGFFGMRIGEIKRAAQHVEATRLIWQGLVPALAERGLLTVEDTVNFLAEKPPSKKKVAAALGESAKKKTMSYEYRVDRAKRLALPAGPGIYKMIAKSGEILYVGKATSLKDRVNSYFRGKKGRDPRKLEMMAQVWDLEITECGSAVEAALVESDEIKRLNPPYNVSLKDGGRSLLYYDRSLTSESLVQSVDHPIGPFRRFNSIDHLRLFAEGLREDLLRNVFYRPIENETLERGYEMFAEKFPLYAPERWSIRQHLAFGMKLLRSRTAGQVESANDVSGLVSDEVVSDAIVLDDETYTPEEILEKIENLYMSAAQTYLRAKMLTRLLWSDVRWTEKDGEKKLIVRGGDIRGDDVARPDGRHAWWRGLAISDYDRMSVLLSEISKHSHEILPVR